MDYEHGSRRFWRPPRFEVDGVAGLADRMDADDVLKKSSRNAFPGAFCEK